MMRVVISRISAVFLIGLAVLNPSQPLVAGPMLPLYAMPITLAWDPANDASVSGYAVYYGLASQSGVTRLDAGTNTTATMFGLLANAPYRVYAVSYDTQGQESVPSNELLFTPPALSRVKLVRQGDGQLQLSAKAAPRSVCTVQFTPTLHPAAWQTLMHATADQAGNVIAVDASGSRAVSRFYRVVLGALPLLGDLQIQLQADGDLLLTGKAPPGASCLVQYASTPKATSWLTLETVTADPEGNVATLDTTAHQAQRFYRMALP